MTPHSSNQIYLRNQREKTEGRGRIDDRLYRWEGRASVCVCGYSFGGVIVVAICGRACVHSIRIAVCFIYNNNHDSVFKVAVPVKVLILLRFAGDE